MKMSDVFKLPVIKGHLVGRDCVAVCDGNGTFSVVNDSAAPLVIKAINNHDRLKQENAELREALQALVKIEHERFGTLSASGSFHYPVPEDVFRQAKELLNK